MWCRFAICGRFEIGLPKVRLKIGPQVRNLHHTLLLALFLVPANQAFQASPPAADHLLDPFAPGWMLTDTNGDGIVDFISGKVVVPANPTAAENAAAANIAARLGFATTGLTPPVVIPANADPGSGPRIFIGGAAAEKFASLLQPGEGGVFSNGGNIVIAGTNDEGLLAAAEALASRFPYVWKVPGDKLSVLANAVEATPVGLTYLKGKTGIARAIFEGSSTKEALADALKKFPTVHEMVVSGVSAGSEKPMASDAAPTPAAGAAPATDAEAGPQRLDLATLYTMRGLFRGTARMPIPSNLDAQLYVPAGAAGIAMANLAARMGLETTGITLPLATPDPGASAKDIRTKSVIVDGSDLAKEATKKSLEEDKTARVPLAPGEGSLRVVDKAFGRQPAVLISGHASAALGLLSSHLPNLWEQGKEYLSLEEIRYDLHRFFSLRSSAGQASAALYRLDKWMEEINGPVHDVEARVFIDIADEGLKDIVQKEVSGKLKAAVKVETGSLHAGTQCCERTPALHYQAPGYTFHQGKPAFQEDLTIPWEGTRLLNAVKAALPKLKGQASVKLVARVSEGPEQRAALAKQIRAMLGNQASVTVLCAFKQGFSWLMDDVAPQLKSKPVASIRIGFKKNEDPTGMRVMYSPARWVHELYPVDEALAKELNIPLEKITLDEYEGGPTYRVHALDASGKEILRREFTVATAMQPYNGVFKRYEQVEVDTGWLRIEAGASVITDQRIKTDIEEFWDHYQNQTLPRIFKIVMSQSHGELRPEFAPIFDTLRIDIHMSEPDYNLGIDKEHISSLEALQEDTFYSTENFANMIGDLEAGRAVTYVGRIIPIVHAPIDGGDDGKDGRVHIEFYAKPAANPMVELKWTDAQGKHHEKKRNFYALTGAMQPRLIEARATAGGPQSLTWLLPADFKDDQYNEWVKLEGTAQVERGIFPVEQAKGQMHWLELMQSNGLYKDELAYPYLLTMAVEFELPLPLSAKIDSPAPREIGSWRVLAPAFKRPMIADFRKAKPGPLVQWDEPIPPSENAAVLAKLSENPGVSAYWMGRSYLGQNLWAADAMLPSPALLKSWAKETTLKAAIVYSGRQHANEVSSTSHILKLGEQLISDDATRALLKQVNVVLHPITNSDGADLSVQLAEITPNNMLHPGYHGSLAADVVAGQAETDPVYPESRTRRQLLESWLPDAFLNPHGYPSHEWVQPFSEYSAWVTTRQGANNGRAWWIPRGWFTSLTYLRDDTHLYSEKIAYEIRDRIVAAQRSVPSLMELENRMNARYQRFGQQWQPEDMQQPLVDGVRIYMALKGSAGRGGGAGGGTGGATGGVSPDVTWDSGYTEAPDETAHGDYMKLMASAGLAFDRVHLEYLGKAKLRINRTEREQAGRVTWRVERLRPNLPAGEPEPPRAAEPRP